MKCSLQMFPLPEPERSRDREQGNIEGKSEKWGHCIFSRLSFTRNPFPSSVFSAIFLTSESPVLLLLLLLLPAG